MITKWKFNSSTHHNQVIATHDVVLPLLRHPVDLLGLASVGHALDAYT